MIHTNQRVSTILLLQNEYEISPILVSEHDKLYYNIRIKVHSLLTAPNEGPGVFNAIL